MVNKKLPKVSIIIPVYNGSKYMEEAIDSALAQTYKNIEIIVVNDGSNDGGKTDKIALSYGNKIKYYKKENGGVSTALNLAIKKMSGEYVSWLSHDDVYFPDKLEKQINYMFSNNYENKNIILYSDYDLIDNKSRLKYKCIKEHDMLIEKPEYALLRGSINGITLLIPKRAFDEFGLFDENLRCTQDYEMWQRMSKKYRFEHMIGILAKSRQHQEQVSIKNPRVITEGNKFWTDLITSVSKKTMIKLEGSEYGYYKEMARFLVESPYTETAKFCDTICEKMEKQVEINTKDIKVSVIIPFYNKINLLIRSIKSVIVQTHKNVEILVINDGYTESLSKLKDFIKQDKRIKLINIEKNQGASNARNKGIDSATGEYIAFLDADDQFVSNKIEYQLLQMVLYDSSISHTSYIKRIGNKDTAIDIGTLTGNVIPKIICNCTIATPCVMIKKDLLDSKNYRFNIKLTIGEDTCFWLQLLRNNKLLGIDEKLTIVNVNEGSSAYNVEKQIIGLKTVIGFVLNDSEYNKYSYEIALLCNAYIKAVNSHNNKHIDVSDGLCSNCIKIMNSKSWRVTKPLRFFVKGMKLFKEYGLIVTINKFREKYLK